jgi:hypothetical protein
MNRWRLVEIPEGEQCETDLTDAELIGVSIILAHNCGAPRDEWNVYWRAWDKLQRDVKIAIDRDLNED